MKILAFVVLLLCAAGSFATDSSVTGKWRIRMSIAGTETGNPQTCSFEQKGNDLSGVCNDDQGDHNITGTISGNDVTWSIKTPNGREVLYTGKIQSDSEITGSFENRPSDIVGAFTFSAHKLH